MTRRSWLTCAGGAVLPAMAYPIALEPFWLDVTQHAVNIGGGWQQPVRLLHLADLHASAVVPTEAIEHAIRIGREQKPDLVCLTGDFITHRTGFNADRYVRSLQLLARSAPTFAVLGNHDGGAWAVHHRGFADHHLVDEMLGASGITLLHNRAADVSIRGSALQLVGVGDFWSNEVAADAAFSSLNPGVATVLLSHNPDSKDVLGGYSWRLMLSGHTHGGQVLVPFRGPCYAPVVDKRYVAGLGRWRDRQIYVTRGVGNLGGVRFRCRPEVSVLDLT